MKINNEDELDDYLNGFFPNNPEAAQLLRISVKPLLLKRKQNFEPIADSGDGVKRFCPDPQLQQQMPYVAQWLGQSLVREEKWTTRFKSRGECPSRLQHTGSFSELAGLAKSELKKDKRVWAQFKKLNPVRRDINYDNEVVMQWPSGFSVVRMTRPVQLRYETKILNNCIGKSNQEYIEDLRKIDSRSEFYSLRDEQNLPVATIVLDPLSDDKMKLSACDACGTPHPPAIPYAREFILSRCSMPEDAENLQSLGYHKEKNRIVDLLNLKNGARIKGNLSIGDWDLELPDDLMVDGDLSLYEWPRKTMPEGLIVNGELDIKKSKIATWPASLHVKGDLFLNDKLDLSAKPPGVIIEGEIIQAKIKVKGVTP